MKMKKTLAMLMALSMTFAVSSVDVSALDAASIEEQVKAADEANDNFTVNVKELDFSDIQVVSAMGDGFGRIRKSSEEGYSYALIDKDGNTIVPFTNGWSEIHYDEDTGIISSVITPKCMYNGEKSLDVVLASLENHRKSCYFYHKDGTPLFEEGYDIATAMIDGVAVVGNLEKLEEPVTTTVSGYSEASYLYRMNLSVINDKGETLYQFPQNFCYCNLESDNPNNKAGNSHIYQNASRFFGFPQNPSDGLIAFTADLKYDGSFDKYDTTRLDDEWGVQNTGYMDYQGNIVIPQKFTTKTGGFYNGVAWTMDPEEIAMIYIDKTGKQAFDNTFNYTFDFREGYACVGWSRLQEEDQYDFGYIDTNGKIVVPVEYSATQGPFVEGYACMQKRDNSKYGYINTENETIIPFEYDAAYGSSDGLFTVGNDGEFGMVDKDNNVVVPLIFDDIARSTNQVAYAISDGKVYSLDFSDGSETEPSEPTGELSLGNINGDEEVNAKDAAAVLVEAASIGAGNGSAFTEEQTKFADVNGDSAVNAKDGAEILVYAASHGAGDFSGTMEEFVSQKKTENTEQETSESTADENEPVPAEVAAVE